jgi:hypothetical protein
LLRAAASRLPIHVGGDEVPGPGIVTVPSNQAAAPLLEPELVKVELTGRRILGAREQFEPPALRIQLLHLAAQPVAAIPVSLEARMDEEICHVHELALRADSLLMKQRKPIHDAAYRVVVQQNRKTVITMLPVLPNIMVPFSAGNILEPLRLVYEVVWIPTIHHDVAQGETSLAIHMQVAGGEVLFKPMRAVLGCELTPSQIARCLYCPVYFAARDWCPRVAPSSKTRDQITNLCNTKGIGISEPFPLGKLGASVVARLGGRQYFVRMETFKRAPQRSFRREF